MRSIYITGGASGIGLAIAELFKKKGWYVGISDINQDLLNEQKDNFWTGKTDVTNSDEVKQSLEDFCKSTPDQKVDAVVNNAGVLFGGEFSKIDPAKSNLMIDINIKAFTNVAYLSYPYLKKSRGMLLNLCSASSMYGIPGLAVYSSSKFYVKGLTEALELEWEKDQIFVGSVMPPFVKTNMLSTVPQALMDDFGVNLTADQIAKEVFSLTSRSKIHRMITTKGKLVNLLSKGVHQKVKREIFKKIFSGYLKSTIS